MNRFEEERSDRPTRREKRAGAERGEAIAAGLMELTDADVRALALDADIAAELAESREITAKGARRRELRRLGRWLLNFADLDALDEQLKTKRETGAAEARAFQIAERWRARLINEDDGLSTFLERFPQVEEKTLRVLTDDARHEDQTGSPKGAKRKLFRMIRGVATEL